MRWQLVIGEETEHCSPFHRFAQEYPECAMKVENYRAGQIVYLKDNTLQVLFDIGEKIGVYEINLCLSDRRNWLEEMCKKPWATKDMIHAVASAARIIGEIKIRTVKKDVYRKCWSYEHEHDAIEYMKNRYIEEA